MALIAGARTFHQVHATWKAGFMPVMKVSWVTSPIALAFAQKFLPEDTWVPFFNIIAFTIGTYINATTKKKRLAALRKKHYDETRGGRDDYPGGKWFHNQQCHVSTWVPLCTDNHLTEANSAVFHSIKEGLLG